VTRWQPSSIRQLLLYCNRRHGFRRGRDSKRRPFLGLHPGFAVPPAFLPIGTSVPPRALALGSRWLRGCGWLGVHSPFHRKGPLDCRTNPTPVRFHAFTGPPTKHTDQLLLLPTSQQTCRDKTKFSGSQVQWYSLRLVFLPHIRFTAKSAAPVGSSCQSRLCSSARRIPQNRAVLASAPVGSAPLRRLTAPPCAHSLANYETNVFYWPAKAQLT
jgi:hypothetical protein